MNTMVDVIDRNGRRTQIPATWFGTRLGDGYAATATTGTTPENTTAERPTRATAKNKKEEV